MSKRKWDQPGPANDEGAPSSKAESASDAAAAAAAIAAKIAAQFAGGPLGGAMRDPHDAEFTHDIDINDIRNRYLLTKSSTQQEIQDETGASVSTKGTWYPDRSKATEKDPPLYLHIMASSKESLQRAIDKVNELMSIDMGSLVEDKKDRMREKVTPSTYHIASYSDLGFSEKWPEEKLPVGLESIRNFNVRAKVVGPSGSFVKYIQQETGTRVQIKGVGSGFIDQETGRESEEPLYIHITGPEESQVARAKVLTEDLLLVVRAEHAKMAAVVQQQQMELHQAQAQYAAYNAMSGYAPPPPSGAPPPPPGEQPPPPPDGQPPAPPANDPNNADAYAQYWAAYGYDVNSAQFKEWMSSQQQQYSQYYATQGYYPTGDASEPQPPQQAPPPPPPPS